MAQPLKDSFLDLERHRQLLEANVAKLRKSLQHWQTWSAEYEGLKEEILRTPSITSHEQLLSIGQVYEADLITQSDIDDIFGIKAGSPRDQSQIVNVIEKRIDYVTQNITTVEKQLQAAEEKFEKAAVIGRPEVRNEEGLPLMEIVEELDEDGNVIQGRAEAQGSSRSVLDEVLKKAQAKIPPTKTSTETENTAKISSETSNAKSKDDTPPRPEQTIESAKAAKEVPEVGKPEPAENTEEDAHHPVESESTPEEAPIIPTNETPEEAALRKEMLQYSMSEIGAVVAELDLEEESDLTDSGYDDEDEDVSSLEEEDEFGRSTRPLINDEMRRRMTELEEKLGVRMMQNAGPTADVGVVDEGIGRIAIQHSKQDEKVTEKPKKQQDGEAKKAVRFADALDISPAPEETVYQAEVPSAVKDIPSSAKSPVGDVIERTAPTQKPLSSNIPPAEVSKFKSSRMSIPRAPILPSTIAPTTSARPVPSGPANATLASKVQERDVNSSAVAEPDEVDLTLMQKEVATEYYKVRNRMIQKQGGFKGPEAEEERTGIVLLTEEEGGPKKVSRFMAARLAKS